MLVIFLLFALVRTLQGVPLSSTADAADSFSDLTLRDIQSHFGQRTVNDIVISCFATIFACTWKAIHPNIPAPMDCWWTRFKRQVITMVYALIAPELITVWALRQRLAAKQIMDEYNKEVFGARETETEHSILNTIKGLFYDSSVPESSENPPQWTLTHGFFMQMGGFMLSDRGKPLYTLFYGQIEPRLIPIPDDEQLIYNIKNGIIDAPRITEAEIQDRSKGDAISKLFIILQTTWFIAQCLARWTQHLPVTELEIITLGFAMLNGITYALWWNKPQNVGRPVFLERKTQQSIPENTVEYPSVFLPTIPEGSDEVPISDTLDTEREPILSHSRRFRKVVEALKFTEDHPNLAMLMFWPSNLLAAFLLPLGKLTTNAIIKKDYRVPMFYAAYTNARDVNAQFIITIPIIGVIFGAIHLIPSWFLDFSSRQEMWLWRTSVLIITTVPVLSAVSGWLINVFDDHVIMGSIVLSLAWIGFILYPFARIILLILSLTSLCSLPTAALQTIKWTTFIPHL